MRLAILTASIIVLGMLVVLGIVHLVRDLLIDDLFHPPSMPGEAANQPREGEPEASPRSAAGTHS